MERAATSSRLTRPGVAAVRDRREDIPREGLGAGEQVAMGGGQVRIGGAHGITRRQRRRHESPTQRSAFGSNSPVDSEHRHRRVAAAEVRPPDARPAHACEARYAATSVTKTCSETRSSGCPPAAGERGDQVSRREVELLDDRRAGDAPVGGLRGLAAEVDGPPRGARPRHGHSPRVPEGRATVTISCSARLIAPPTSARAPRSRRGGTRRGRGCP